MMLYYACRQIKKLHIHIEFSPSSLTCKNMLNVLLSRKFVLKTIRDSLKNQVKIFGNFNVAFVQKRVRHRSKAKTSQMHSPSYWSRMSL